MRAPWPRGFGQQAVKSFAQNVVQFADSADQYNTSDAAWEKAKGSGDHAGGGGADDMTPRPVWSWKDDSGQGRGVWNLFSDENIRTLEEV